MVITDAVPEPPSGAGRYTATELLADEELEDRIRQFTEDAKRFSRDFVNVAGPLFNRDPVRSTLVNVELAKSIFSKWVIEILLTLYSRGELGFQDLGRALVSIRPRVLSQKLRLLEERGLVQRTVLPTRPARVRYALTRDGLVLAKLGEPVFIFLRYRRDRRGSPRVNGSNVEPSVDETLPGEVASVSP